MYVKLLVLNVNITDHLKPPTLDSCHIMSHVDYFLKS